MVGIEPIPGPRGNVSARKKRVSELAYYYEKMKRPKLQGVEKGQMIMGFKMNLTNKEIARQVGCSPKTVRMWRVRYDEDNKLERKKIPGSGQPQSLSPKDKTRIKLLAARDRNLNAIQICDEIKGFRWSDKGEPNTVRRQLKILGLNGRIKRRKPLLSIKNKAARLAWAIKYQHMRDEWRSVVFTDESPFTIFPKCGKQYVWRRPGEEYDERLVAPTVKHGGGKIQVWGAFHYGGPGPIRRITEKTMNATV
jgi:transposase